MSRPLQPRRRRAWPVPAPGERPAPRWPSRPDLEAMLVGAIIAAATGLLTAFSRAADLARDGRHVPLWVTLLEDQTSVLLIIVLLPAVLWLLRRVPLAEGPLWRWLPPHLAAM